MARPPRTSRTLVVAVAFWGVAGVAGTAFEFPIQQNFNNHLFYRSYVQDVCVDIVPSTAKPCTVSQDCSPLIRYDCEVTDTSQVLSEAEVVEMTMQGQVDLSLRSCGEGTCPWCTSYQSCVGPMIETNQQELPAGSCILWEYHTLNTSFEVFVGAFSDAEELLSYELKRGELVNEWLYGQVQVTQNGPVFLRFYLAGYDSSGDGQVSSKMLLRNVRPQLSCLNSEALATGPTTTTASTSVTSTRSATMTTSSTTSFSVSTSSSSSSRSSTSMHVTVTVTSSSTTTTTLKSGSFTSTTRTNTSRSVESTTSTSTTQTSMDETLLTSGSPSCECETNELMLVFLALGAFFLLLLLLPALCRQHRQHSESTVVPEVNKLDRMMQILRSFGLEDEEDLKLALQSGKETKEQLEELKRELEVQRLQGQKLENLRQEHFALQHRLMNERRLCGELRRVAATREVQLIVPERWDDDERLLS